MPKRFYIFVLAGLTALAISNTQAQNSSGAKTTSATNGKQMYDTYCSSCHGKDGKGYGPAAGALSAHPTNLTTLAKTHGGKYPAAEVAAVLKSGVHGSQDMPVWGPVFGSMNKANPTAEEQKRINTLVEFIRISQVQ
jgi:mono/diheme cytochrome c family protein